MAVRLMDKKLIETAREEGNQKALYYVLMGRGKRFFVLHQDLHACTSASLKKHLGRYRKGELEKCGETLGGISTALIQIAEDIYADSVLQLKAD